MKKKRVIIIGSGLAGLSAGLELQSSGYEVTILEGNPYVGGRTASWNKDGMEVESGLHRVLGFYKEFPRLIKRVGLSVKDVVIWEDELEIKVPNGPSYVYGGSFVFRPIKTISGILFNNLLTWKETFQLARFLVNGLILYFKNPLKLDQISVHDYAKKFHVSDKAITRVLHPLTAGIFFLPPERYSSYVLFGLLGQGIKRFWKIRIGAFKGGMSAVLTDPIAEKIRDLGGAVLLNSPVEKILIDNDTFTATGVIASGQKLSAEYVILATGLGPAQAIIQNSEINGHSLADKFTKLFTLPTMPEINIQFECSEPMWPVDRTVFGAGSNFVTFAEQSRTTFGKKSKTKEDKEPEEGRLSVILTPPEKFMEMSKEEIFEAFKKEAPKLGIDPAKVKKYRVIKHPADFYLLSPGTEALRPSTTTAISNLFLAGDYVKQKFLATMEGAIISGLNAADEIKKK